MTINAKTVDEYISKLPEDRKNAVSKLRDTVQKKSARWF